jgi:nitroreductase
MVKIDQRGLRTMDFFEAVQRRRSVRKYTARPVPEDVIQRALDAAVLAPNSSNLQTWQFYWVQTPELKQKLIEACLNQSAARTAQELIVVAVNRKLYRVHAGMIADHLEKQNVEPRVLFYYRKLIPWTYGWAILSPIRWALSHLIGLFRPMVRMPARWWDQNEVPIKSAALAAENFMLAISAQGFDTCPMEGMDESRVKKLLRLPWGSRVVMVISVGERDPEGIWGEQYRVPRERVIHET